MVLRMSDDEFTWIAAAAHRSTTNVEEAIVNGRGTLHALEAIFVVIPSKGRDVLVGDRIRAAAATRSAFQQPIFVADELIALHVEMLDRATTVDAGEAMGMELALAHTKVLTRNDA